MTVLEFAGCWFLDWVDMRLDGVEKPFLECRNRCIGKGDVNDASTFNPGHLGNDRYD